MAITEWEISRGTIGAKTIQVVLCDDDPVFSQRLQEELITVFSRLHITPDIRSFNSTTDLTPQTLSACDLAFFDIDFEYEDCNGIDIARRLRQYNGRALLFFVTNYIEYAPEGFEVQAFRYILKRKTAQVLERYILQALDQLAEGMRALRLRDMEHMYELPLDQVIYLEVQGHYVIVHTGQTEYTLATSLTSMEKELEEMGFLRIHKSFLVNMAHIRKFRSRECLLADGTMLTVSEKNYSQQKQKYLLWKGLS